jgi:hypothetical protein
VSCAVNLSQLWPLSHDLLNVGLTASAVDSQDGPRPVEILVFSDEDDEEPTGDGTHSPDAKDIASGTLRLRAERKGDGDGRVYLIVVKATDSSGNVGVCCSAQSQRQRSGIGGRAGGGSPRILSVTRRSATARILPSWRRSNYRTETIGISCETDLKTMKSSEVTKTRKPRGYDPMRTKTPVILFGPACILLGSSVVASLWLPPAITDHWDFCSQCPQRPRACSNGKRFTLVHSRCRCQERK